MTKKTSLKMLIDGFMCNCQKKKERKSIVPFLLDIQYKAGTGKSVQALHKAELYR